MKVSMREGMNALSARMRHTMIGLILVGAALLLLTPGTVTARFFPVETLQSGTKGTGKTVMRGTAVESFEVEYIGVMRDAGPSGDLILIRVSGAAVERSGGIAAGMSGSPVYIDDQLVGAIGYGFDMADHRVGLVTPIGDMLEVLERIPSASEPSEPGDGGNVVNAAVTADGGDRGPHGAWLASSVAEAEALAETATADTAVFAPMQTPIMASGFSSRALDDLTRRLKPFQMTPVLAGGAPDDATDGTPLQAGSAFGVQLARGDIELTSIGTVTYVDADRFVGFGHPFTNRGPVEFIASSAYVHDVVQATSIPFKLGSPLHSVGTLLEDRGAAVGARLGAEPDMIPVTVSVYDADRDTTSLREFEIVRDNEYTVALATSGALALLDRSVDRLGRGTAHVVFHVEGDGLSRPLIRDNIYYSDFDISALSLLEFMEAVSLVVNNRFQPVDVNRIRLSARIEQQRRTAHVEHARPEHGRVFPGDTVSIDVTLRPYREEPVTVPIQLTIPHDAGRGLVTVDVRGGGWGLRPPVEEEDTILDDPEELLGETVSDLTLLIDRFTRRERNNELVAEFYGPRRTAAPDDAPPQDADAPARDGTGNDEAAKAHATDGEWQQTFPGGGWVVSTRPTEYVLIGSHMFDLQIMSPEDEEEPEEAAVGVGDGEPAPDEDGGAAGVDPPLRNDGYTFEY